MAKQKKRRAKKKSQAASAEALEALNRENARKQEELDELRGQLGEALDMIGDQSEISRYNTERIRRLSESGEHYADGTPYTPSPTANSADEMPSVLSPTESEEPLGWLEDADEDLSTPLSPTEGMEVANTINEWEENGKNDAESYDAAPGVEKEAEGNVLELFQIQKVSILDLFLNYNCLLQLFSNLVLVLQFVVLCLPTFSRFHL